MSKKNVVRQDVVQIGFEVEEMPLKKLEKVVENVQSSMQDMAQTADKAATEASKIGTEAIGAAQSADRLKNSGFKDVKEDAKQAGEQAEKFGDKTKEGANKSGEAIEDLTSSVGDLTSAFAGVAAAFAVGQIISGVSEVEQAINRLEAQTGATADEMNAYSDAVNNLYTSGNGESIGDVANSLALVNQQFKNLDTGTMENIANDAMVLSDTFDMDFNETLRGVNSLMTNMGLTADESFDYIAKGAQNGLNKTGELTDNLAEYAQIWSQAGFSAEEMFTILQNGLDSGAYNLDKVNDFVKEFAISLSDGRIEENIDNFSEGTQKVFEQWKSGSATQKDVFNSIINDLGNMTNEQEALTVASTVWSALGEDNAMKVITSLTAVNDTYGDVKNTMESINEVRYDDIGSSLEKVSRSASTALNQMLAPALSKVNNAISDGLDWVTNFAKEHETLATGIGAAALSATALSVGIGVVVAAAHFVPPIIAKITASLTAMNMSMGAVGIAITGISTAIGLASVALSNSKEDVEDYDGTLEECRYEIERTESAHKKAVERYGENSEAAKDLEKDLEKLSAQYEKGGGIIGELNQRLEENKKAFEEASKAQEDATKSISDTEIQGYQAVSMLEALSSKTQRTSSDLDLMADYADYLNDTFNCDIKVNYETGELTGFDPKVVVQQIIDAANKNKIQVSMDFLTNTDITSGYVDQFKVVNSYKDAVAEAEKELAELKELNDGWSAWNSSWGDEYGNWREYSLAVDEAERKLKDTQSSLEDAENTLGEMDSELERHADIVDESGKTYDMLRDSLQQTAESGGEYISMAEETAGATEQVNEGLSMAQDAVSAYNDELYELATAYDEALVAAQESVAGQYAVWDEVGDIAETSIGELQSALQSQSDYWSDYADNLALLQEKAQNIEGLSGLLASMADGSEDSAAAISALAGASDEELSNVVADWQLVKDKQDEASANMALTQTEFQTKLTTMGTDMQTFVDKMNMETDATTNASKTINAFINTIISTVNTRKSEVDIAIQSLMSSANTYSLTISKPAEEVQQNANGTTNADDVFISGENGAELIVGKKGSTVFPASETDKIISAVQDYTGGYSPTSSRPNSNVIHNATTYAPQFTLNLNGASATNENKRTVKRWIKESMKEVFDNLNSDNSPIIEI